MNENTYIRIPNNFFDRSPLAVAPDLLGKVLYHKVGECWLTAQIIETEAYLLTDRASHASLGYTEKRKALFMPAGTIYMYYARGGPSLNFSCQGLGNAVLIKSAVVYPFENPDPKLVSLMQELNPCNGRMREITRLCSGQTLLCRSLGIKVADWDQQQLDDTKLFLGDVGDKPMQILQMPRLGIPKGRDEDLPYRFIDKKFIRYTTKG